MFFTISSTGCVFCDRRCGAAIQSAPGGLSSESSRQPRTVLVTGATGFVGRHLCRHFIERGDRIIVLTRKHGLAWHLYGPHAQIVTSLETIDAAERIDVVVNLVGAAGLAIACECRAPVGHTIAGRPRL